MDAIFAVMATPWWYSVRTTRRLEGHAKEVRNVAVSPDGQVAVSNGKDETLRLWNIADGKELKHWDNVYHYRLGFVFAPDSRRFATIDNKEVRIYSVSAAAEIKSCVHKQSVTCLAFSRDGRQLLTGCYDGIMRFWKLPD